MASGKSYRVGVIGFGHMHINDVMRRFSELPNVQWVACADTIPDVPEARESTFTRAWNAKYAHETIGIPKVYNDYREMLEREKFDLIGVYRGHGAEPEVFSCEPLPEEHKSIAHELVHHLATGEPLHPTLEPEFNLEAMAILDAGIRSLASGKLELVDNWRWCVK